MENLIHQKLQELEQLRHNLLHNLSCSGESANQASVYQQMSLEVVEGCQEVLREVVETLKCSEERARSK